MTDSNRTVKIGVVVVVAAASVFGLWRIVRTDRVAEPTAPTFAPAVASPGSADGAASPSSASREEAGPPPGQTRPPKPQTYPTTTSSVKWAGVPLRPMDLEIFAMIEKGDIGDGRDVFPKRPYQVTIMRDHISGYVMLVMIDTKRSGTIDERWKLTPDSVMRQVADEKGRFLDDFSLRAGLWTPR